MTTELRRMVADEVLAEIAAADRDPIWLVDAAGLPADALADRLAGRADFTVTELARICLALDVPVSTLLRRIDARL